MRANVFIVQSMEKWIYTVSRLPGTKSVLIGTNSHVIDKMEEVITFVYSFSPVHLLFFWYEDIII